MSSTHTLKDVGDDGDDGDVEEGDEGDGRHEVDDTPTSGAWVGSVGPAQGMGQYRWLTMRRVGTLGSQVGDGGVHDDDHDVVESEAANSAFGGRSRRAMFKSRVRRSSTPEGAAAGTVIPRPSSSSLL